MSGKPIIFDVVDWTPEIAARPPFIFETTEYTRQQEAAGRPPLGFASSAPEAAEAQPSQERARRSPARPSPPHGLPSTP